MCVRMGAINSPRNTERDVDSKLELMLVIQPCGIEAEKKGEEERERGRWSLAKHSLVISVCRQGGGATPARTIRYIDRARRLVQLVSRRKQACARVTNLHETIPFRGTKRGWRRERGREAMIRGNVSESWIGKGFTLPLKSLMNS